MKIHGVNSHKNHKAFVQMAKQAKALPEYYIKYSQFENAKSDYLNRLSSKLSFEALKPKGMSFYKIKEAF